MASNDIKITPLHRTFAARIDRVQVGDEMGQDIYLAVREALDNYGVLVFPNQKLNIDQLQHFAQRFGDLETFPEVNMQKVSPKVYNISNVDAEGDFVGKNSVQARMLKGTELWHTDSSYRAMPALASFLHALEVPAASEKGGQTEFANMIAAYEEMPDNLLCQIKHQSMVHNYEYERLYVDTELPPIPIEVKQQLPPVTHPVIRYHPHNNKQSVYITANVGNAIGGYDYEKGQTLHAEVLDFVTRTEFVYRHYWDQYDLLVWDNRRLLHRLVPYDVSRSKRVMQRTTVSDTTPPRACWR